VSLGLWYEENNEKDADKAEETKKPERSMGANRRYQVVEEFSYCEAASPVESCSYRCSVTTNLAWENFSHLNQPNRNFVRIAFFLNSHHISITYHKPRDRSITDGKGDDVDYECSQWKPTDVFEIMFKVLQNEEDSQCAEADCHKESGDVE
jgi:hypothetical protein